MILFVNDAGEIKDVGSTKNENLHRVEVSDESNPFLGWGIAKICCFKIEEREGCIVTYVPYVNYSVVEQLDKLETLLDSNVTDTQLAVTETYEKTMENESYITELELALTEIYEMLG